jgi:uncharacterized protein YcbX
VSHPPTVTALSVTAIKGTRLRTVDSVELRATGPAGDRRFYLIDERDRMVNAKSLGALQTAVAAWDEASARLVVTRPDGGRVEGVVAAGSGPLVETRFYSRERPARLVEGPWSEALSEVAGQPLRLVEPEPPRGGAIGSAVDRGAGGAVSLISQGSLEQLAGEAERDSIDARRFRMLIEVDGVPAHEEDGWVGRAISIGDTARVRFQGHVGRCLITNRDPDSGVVDLPTLDLLFNYRHGLETTEPLAFGIYGRVLQVGTIRVGDPVTILPGR